MEAETHAQEKSSLRASGKDESVETRPKAFGAFAMAWRSIGGKSGRWSMSNTEVRPRDRELTLFKSREPCERRTMDQEDNAEAQVGIQYQYK